MKLRKVSEKHEIFLSEEQIESANPKVVIKGDRIFYRFMDRLYIPDHVYNLDPQFVADLNGIRDKYKKLIVNNEYNAFVAETLVHKTIRNESICGNILDFGCGTGDNAIILKSTFPQHNIYGFDIRNVHSIDGYKSTKYGDYGAPLPYKNNFFQSVFSFFVFHFSVSNQQLSELFRILVDGGFLSFNLINSADYEVINRVLSSGFKLDEELSIELGENKGIGFIFRANKTGFKNLN